MKTLLKNIASIQTGLFAKPAGKGKVVYLQSKHFDENGRLSAFLYPDLEVESLPEKHLLKEGDVLFAAKGTKNFATVYENHNEPAVASTSFFVIKITETTVLPQFLAWFLNSPSTQTLLKGQAIGTSIPSISKQVLDNLEIIVPDFDTQHLILQITKLRNRENELKQKIEMLREKQIQAKLLWAISQR